MLTFAPSTDYTLTESVHANAKCPLGDDEREYGQQQERKNMIKHYQRTRIAIGIHDG